jgi:hypothetical protein
MTRAEKSPEQVKLTIGEKIKIGLAIGGVLAGQWLALNSQVQDVKMAEAQMEVAAKDRDRRLDELEKDNKDQRNEMLRNQREILGILKR